MILDLAEKWGRPPWELEDEIHDDRWDWYVRYLSWQKAQNERERHEMNRARMGAKHGR